MTKVEQVTKLLETTDYQGKMKKDVDAWIAKQVGCCIGLVQKLRIGWYQKLYNTGDPRKTMQSKVAKQNQAMATKWKAPKRIRK